MSLIFNTDSNILTPIEQNICEPKGHLLDACTPRILKRIIGPLSYFLSSSSSSSCYSSSSQTCGSFGLDDQLLKESLWKKKYILSVKSFYSPRDWGDCFHETRRAVRSWVFGLGASCSQQRELDALACHSFNLFSFCQRACMQGWELVYEPAPCCHHWVTQSAEPGVPSAHPPGRRNLKTVGQDINCVYISHSSIKHSWHTLQVNSFQ